MIEFMYTSTYTISKKKTQAPASPENPAKRRKLFTSMASLEARKTAQNKNEAAAPKSLITHVKMYVIADKYDIKALKTHAKEKYLQC